MLLWEISEINREKSLFIVYSSHLKYQESQFAITRVHFRLSIVRHPDEVVSLSLIAYDADEYLAWAA